MSKSLLRTNAKLEKNFGRAADYLVAGLTLAPNRLARLTRDDIAALDILREYSATASALDDVARMITVCQWATSGCIGACNLWFSGQRVTPQARACAVRETKALFTDPAAFYDRLRHDIGNHIRSAERKRLRPLVRLNVASDLDWRDIIAEYDGACLFYDYTKSVARMREYLRGALPANYHLTFSHSERTHKRTTGSILARGGNVAAVIDTPYHPQSGAIGPLPTLMRFGGVDYPVIDGDKHDVCLPWIDGVGVVRGLRLKGTNAAKDRARKSGFALPIAN